MLLQILLNYKKVVLTLVVSTLFFKPPNLFGGTKREEEREEERERHVSEHLNSVHIKHLRSTPQFSTNQEMAGKPSSLLGKRSTRQVPVTPRQRVSVVEKKGMK